MVNNPSASAGDMGLIPRLERSPTEGNGNPLQYSCLGNPMDRGAWQAYRPSGPKRIEQDLATKHNNKAYFHKDALITSHASHA